MQRSGGDSDEHNVSLAGCWPTMPQLCSSRFFMVVLSLLASAV